MSKQHIPGPVPPANRPNSGPPQTDVFDPTAAPGHGQTEGFEEQDPKRRIGDFEGKGEHSRQQPTSLNDGTTHSK